MYQYVGLEMKVYLSIRTRYEFCLLFFVTVFFGRPIGCDTTFDSLCITLENRIYKFASYLSFEYIYIHAYNLILQKYKYSLLIYFCYFYESGKKMISITFLADFTI